MSMILPILTFLPLLGALLCLLVPREEASLHRGIGLFTSLVTFAASLLLLPDFEPAKMSYVVRWPWAPSLGIEFHLGIDGISLWLVMLTTFLLPVVFLSTWTAITDKVREFVVAALVLQAELALAVALRAVAAEQPSSAGSDCQAHASVADEIVRMAKVGGSGANSEQVTLTATATRQQLVDFGRLLRDRRNQAGLSRLQLARKAKLSDSTVKFAETARHPPSRQTLLRLVDVPELALDWSDTPGYCPQTAPASIERADPSLGIGLHRLDSRLTLPMVREALLVLDALHANLYLVEVSARGARRACSVCGMRSEAWAVDAHGAAKLPVHHAAHCAGQQAEALYRRHPVIAELAQDERRTAQSETATELAASRRSCPTSAELPCPSRTPLPINNIRLLPPMTLNSERACHGTCLRSG